MLRNAWEVQKLSSQSILQDGWTDGKVLEWCCYSHLKMLKQVFHWSSGIFMSSKICNLLHSESYSVCRKWWASLRTCQCVDAPWFQADRPFSSVLSLCHTTSVLLLTESLGYFTKQFSAPNNHTTLLAIQIIQYRVSFLKIFSQGNVTWRPDFVQWERNTCQWLFPSPKHLTLQSFLGSFALWCQRKWRTRKRHKTISETSLPFGRSM